METAAANETSSNAAPARQGRSTRAGDGKTLTVLAGSKGFVSTGGTMAMDHANERVYSFGGSVRHVAKDVLGVYDVREDSWTSPSTTGETPPAMIFSASCFHAGRFYVHGGRKENHRCAHGGWLHAYHPATREWSRIDLRGDTPGCRIGHTLTVIPGRNECVLFGGRIEATAAEEMIVVNLDSGYCSAVCDLF